MRSSRCPITLRLLLLLVSFSLSNVALADTFVFPHLLDYQAQLTDPAGDPVPDGTFPIYFRIYDGASDGNLLWTEFHPAVSTSRGAMTASLGSITPIPMDSLSRRVGGTSKELYLEIQIEGDLPMSPRTRLGGALFAAVASRINGDISTSKGLLVMLDSLGDTTSIWDANAKRGIITNLHPPMGDGGGHQVSQGIDDSSSFMELVDFSTVDSNQTRASAGGGRSILRTYFETGDIPTQAGAYSTADSSGVGASYDNGARVAKITATSLAGGTSLRIAEDQDNADGTSSRYEFTVRPNRMELIRGIREGGHTIGAGQITSLGLGRFLMLDSLDDGTVSKILDRGEAGDNVGRRAARTGRNPQTGATIQMSAETILDDTAGASFSLRRLDDDSDDDGLLDLVVNEDGASLRMNKAELIDAIASSASITVDTSEAKLTLSKADAKRALEALTSASRVGLYLIDSTLNDSGLIGMQISDGGNSGVTIKSARKVVKFKAGAALASTVRRAPLGIEIAGSEGAYVDLSGDLDHFVTILVDSVSSSMVFADTLGDTTVVIEGYRDGGPGGTTTGGIIKVVSENVGTGMAPSRVEISDLDGDGLVDVRIDGNVGVGVASPTTILQVQQGSLTDPIADAWTTYSSRRWKENISPIENAIEKVMQLRGVEYDWKENGQHDIGLIAEEVGAVIPEVVVYEENGIDARSVDYPRLVALLIEASKAQQTQVETMQAEIQQLKELVQTLAKRSNGLTETQFGQK